MRRWRTLRDVLALYCAQSCLTLYRPMDCSLPSASVHGISQARTLENTEDPHQGIFLTKGSNLGLLYCTQILYCLSHQGSSLLLCHKLWTTSQPETTSICYLRSCGLGMQEQLSRAVLAQGLSWCLSQALGCSLILRFSWG